ncbi:MAG TPA: hypothetical protein VL523_01885 [Terriglobia bacterium]|nr:hypothetical protein [Terriglobia bacterium]
MASNIAKVLGVSLVAAGLQILGAAPAPAQQAQPAAAAAHPAPPARHAKAAFGGPTTLRGTIAMVKPDQSLVVIARTGPGEPTSPQASWTQTKARGTGEVVDQSKMTLTQGPGETDYAFKITSATVIRVNGKKVALADLAASQNQPATVRFTAARQGDFALSIEVGQ